MSSVRDRIAQFDPSANSNKDDTAPTGIPKVLSVKERIANLALSDEAISTGQRHAGFKDDRNLNGTSAVVVDNGTSKSGSRTSTPPSTPPMFPSNSRGSRSSSAENLTSHSGSRGAEKHWKKEPPKPAPKPSSLSKSSSLSTFNELNTSSSSFSSAPEFNSSLLRSSQSNPSLRSIPPPSQSFSMPRSSSPSSSPESRSSSISMSSTPLQIVNSNNSQFQPSLPPRPKSINSIENIESRSSSVSLNSSGGFTKSTFTQNSIKGGPPPLPSRSNSVGSDLDSKDTGMTRSSSGNSLKASTAGLSRNGGNVKENQNPFEDNSTASTNSQHHPSKSNRDQCPIPLSALKRYLILFNQYAEPSASSSLNTIAGATVKTIWAKSRLNFDALAKIWRLVSTNQKEELVSEEFVVGVWLIDEVLSGRSLPDRLSASLQPTSFRKYIDSHQVELS